jgi:hydrogenase maturation factor
MTTVAAKLAKAANAAGFTAEVDKNSLYVKDAVRGACLVVDDQGTVTGGYVENFATGRMVDLDSAEQAEHAIRNMIRSGYMAEWVA